MVNFQLCIIIFLNSVVYILGTTWPKTKFQLNDTSKNVGVTLNQDSKIYIAGIDYFLEINQENNGIRKIEFLADSGTLQTCQSLGRETCFNSIVVLQAISNDELLICGSNSGRPQCYYYNTTSASRADLNINARTWLTSDMSQVWPSVVANADTDPQLYIGSCTSDCAISRTINDPLSSESDFNNVEFLSGYGSIPDTQKVYFFFREDSSSFIGDRFLPDSGQTSTNAMVSRVCKNDMGGQVQYSNTWMTLVKARLLCPFPSTTNDMNSPNINFDIMVSTYRTGNTIYALFKYPSSWKISSSAICSYDLTTIDNYFDGRVFANNITEYYGTNPPTYTNTFSSNPQPDFLPGQCPAAGQSTSGVGGVFSSFIEPTPIIGKPITPEQSMPVYVDFETIFDFIATLEYGGFTIVFLLKDDGYMQKLRVDPNDYNSTVFLRKTTVDLGGEKILSFSCNNEELIIVTVSQVLLLPISDCPSNNNCSICEADPNCNWLSGSCDTSTSHDTSILRQCADPPLPPSGLIITEDSTAYNAQWNGNGPMYKIQLIQNRDEAIIMEEIIQPSEISILKELIIKGTNYQLNIWSVNSDAQSIPTTSNITTGLDMPLIKTIEFMREYTTVEWELVEEATSYDVTLYARSGPYINILQSLTIMPLSSRQLSMVNAFVGLEVGSGYRISVLAKSLDGILSPESAINFSGVVNEKLTIENGTEVVSPSTSPAPQCPSMAGIIICAIIIILLVGLVLQNHYIIGPRTKVLKRDDPKKVAIRRKFFFLFVKDTHVQQNQKYDTVKKNEVNETDTIA